MSTYEAQMYMELLPWLLVVGPIVGYLVVKLIFDLW